MKITLNLVGILSEHFGTDVLTVELANGARFGDLTNEIALRFGDRLPKSIWDKENMTFKPGILCVGEGRDIDSRETLLKENENITVVILMAGG
jgi:molybdopterin converting factor small subunit